MKKHLALSIGLTLLSSCFLLDAQTVNVRFKASVRTADEEILPGAYVKIYQPGNSIAVDSLFCDEQGMIDRELPFTIETNPSSVPLTYETGYIVKKIYPNVIGRQNHNLVLEYRYPADASLYFMDIRGRVYRNGTELAGGMFFYYLDFSDGNRSELNKIIITENVRPDVQLVNLVNEDVRRKNFLHAWEDQDKFYAEFIKDGYVTLVDTLVIDTAVIEESYTMTEAEVPIASFTFSGDLIAGQPVVFDGSASTGAYGEELDYQWDFGDGKNGGTGQLPHLFTLPGNYTVTLTVSGAYGAKHSISQSLEVTPASVAVIHTGTINGYITDEYLENVNNAEVSLVEGEIISYSNTGGIVSLNGLPVGVPIHLKITKSGYVNQIIELTVPEETGESVFFTTLKNREPGFTLYNAEFGGELEGSDGTRLVLPIMPFEKEDGTEVTGNVDVNITPVDVAFETSSFPGSFFGYNESGEDGVLLSYGVSEYHFEQDGEVLQLAEGKKATIYIPIYTSGAEPGQQIPLWSVNEDNGKWVQEGYGTVVTSGNSPTGLALKAEVSHFSWFNCDDFEEDRKKDGLCFIWDCTSAICVKIKVGCWVSGAQREPSVGKKSLLIAGDMSADRDTIPPVFEVRAYLPSGGKELAMPYSRDIYMEAKAFTNQGVPLVGSFTMSTTYEKDTFEIELTPLMVSDTVDLPLNTLYEDYLQVGEFLQYRLNLPEYKEYQVNFLRTDDGYLNASYNIIDESGIVKTGTNNESNTYFSAGPGEIIFGISGYTQVDKGGFILGIGDPGAWLPGDTTDIEFGIKYEEFLNQTEYKHFRIQLPDKKILRTVVGTGPSPSLSGRFRVSLDDLEIMNLQINSSANFLFLDAGELNLSVAGRKLTDQGNFNIQIDEVTSVPMGLNETKVDSITAGNLYRIYSLNSDHNSVLKISYFTNTESSGYPIIKLLNQNGKTLNSENIYEVERFMQTHLLKDSTYLLLVSGTRECKYTITTAEEESVEMHYGDTIHTGLEYFEDKDLFHFNGTEGELVSIKGFQPNYDLYRGSFVLLTPGGTEIGRRIIMKNTSFNDFEIIYKIPENGKYSILVESLEDDTGRYEIVLDTFNYSVILLNTLTEFDVTAGEEDYIELVVAEEGICHLSVISESGRGRMDIFSEDAARVNDMNSSKYFNNYYTAAYNNRFTAGRYYLKLTNESSGLAYINFLEPEILDLNNKGEIYFPDTIRQARQVNAYYFRGKPGDGIHGMLKLVDKSQIPENLEVKYYPCKTDGKALIIKSQKLNYYSLDSTILFDTGAKLEGTGEDTTWVILIYGKTEGLYDFDFHHVKASSNVVVDDDYVDYPNAQTSSPIAAGYAVKPSGKLFIANGEYTSYLAVYINKDNVDIEGQDKENTWLRQVYNSSSNPVIYFFSEGGSIKELSLSSGNAVYYVIDFNGAGIVLQDLHIKLLPGAAKTGGGIRGNGENVYITDLFLDQTMWGITVGSNGGLIENSMFICGDEAIRLTGEGIIIRNNNVTITSSSRAITAYSSYLGNGTQLVENNVIYIETPTGSSETGAIYVERYGGPENYLDSYIRNNIIHSKSIGPAFSAGIGNPPTKIIAEGNHFYCTNTRGGRAFLLQALRSDGSSDIIVRNNTFDGLTSWDAISLYSSDLVKEGHRFAIYNNSFRMAETADQDVGYNFMRINCFNYNVTDTLPVYLVNNIFKGNGYSYLVKCQTDLTFYADYNIVNDFSSYITGLGHIIGMTNDITLDPLFLDTDLHVDPLSPAINNGATPLMFEFIPDTDINGVSRPQGAGYDMGAYEKEE